MALYVQWQWESLQHCGPRDTKVSPLLLVVSTLSLVHSHSATLLFPLYSGQVLFKCAPLWYDAWLATANAHASPWHDICRVQPFPSPLGWNELLIKTQLSSLGPLGVPASSCNPLRKKTFRNRKKVVQPRKKNGNGVSNGKVPRVGSFHQWTRAHAVTTTTTAPGLSKSVDLLKGHSSQTQGSRQRRGGGVNSDGGALVELDWELVPMEGVRHYRRPCVGLIRPVSSELSLWHHRRHSHCSTGSKLTNSHDLKAGWLAGSWNSPTLLKAGCWSRPCNSITKRLGCPAPSREAVVPPTMAVTTISISQIEFFVCLFQ